MQCNFNMFMLLFNTLTPMLYLTGDMIRRYRQAIFLSGPKAQCVNLTIRRRITTTNFRLYYNK